MGQVSNRFFVTTIKDGTVVTAAIYSNKPLVQLVSEQGSSPDWEESGNQPTVWCVTRTGAVIKTPSSFTWKVNNTAITFTVNPSTGLPDDNAISTNFGGAFQYKIDTEKYGVRVPCIKIIKNLVTFENQDNDMLTCDGYMEYNGADIGFSVSTTIRVGELSSSGYFGWVEGDSFVKAQSGASGTATMKAYLKTAQSTVPDFKSRWFLEGYDTQPAGWPKSVTASSGYATCTITGAEITDYVVVRCDYFPSAATDASIDTYYSGGSSAAGAAEKLFSAFWDVDDMEDQEEMYMASYNDNSDVSNGLDVCLRTDQVVTFMAWVGKRGDQTVIDAKYTTFKVKLMDYQGNVITSLTNSGVQVKNSSGNWVSASFDSGTYNITITTSTTKTGYNGGNSFACGMIRIPASFGDTNGGRMTGIVTAISSE